MLVISDCRRIVVIVVKAPAGWRLCFVREAVTGAVTTHSTASPIFFQAG